MSSLERNKANVIVVQDNALIEASYTLTLNEKRLVLLAASKIDSRRMPNKDTPLEFDVTAEEWAETFADDNPFQSLKRASDRLLSRYVTVYRSRDVTKKMAWFDSVEHFEREGRVHVRFGWSISFHLAGLFQEFTKINLLDFGKLSSFYSIRLLELLKQFSSTGYRRISVEDFRIAMNCVDAYPEMKALKRHVLTPALKEIAEKTTLVVDFKDFKKGRKIVGFDFVLSANSQGDLFK